MAEQQVFELGLAMAVEGTEPRAEYGRRSDYPTPPRHIRPAACISNRCHFSAILAMKPHHQTSDIIRFNPEGTWVGLACSFLPPSIVLCCPGAFKLRARSRKAAENPSEINTLTSVTSAAFARVANIFSVSGPLSREPVLVSVCRRQATPRKQRGSQWPCRYFPTSPGV